MSLMLVYVCGCMCLCACNAFSLCMCVFAGNYTMMITQGSTGFFVHCSAYMGIESVDSRAIRSDLFDSTNDEIKTTGDYE